MSSKPGEVAMGSKLCYTSMWLPLEMREGSEWERIRRDTGNVLFLVLIGRHYTGGFTLGTVTVMSVVSIRKLKGESFSPVSPCVIQEKTLDRFSKTTDLRLSQPNINRKVNSSFLRLPRNGTEPCLGLWKGFRKNIVGKMTWYDQYKLK